MHIQNRLTHIYLQMYTQSITLCTFLSLCVHFFLSDTLCPPRSVAFLVSAALVSHVLLVPRQTVKAKAEARLDLLRQAGVAVETWLKSAMNQVMEELENERWNNLGTHDPSLSVRAPQTAFQTPCWLLLLRLLSSGNRRSGARGRGGDGGQRRSAGRQQLQPIQHLKKLPAHLQSSLLL